jgi:hypothetical protein
MIYLIESVDRFRVPGSEVIYLLGIAVFQHDAHSGLLRPPFCRIRRFAEEGGLSATAFAPLAVKFL